MTDQTSTSAGATPQRDHARSTLLGVIAALLVLLLAREAGPVATAAGPPRDAESAGGIVNPADQRNRMIAELSDLNRRVDALVRTLERGGAKVEVVKMPAAKAE